MSNKYKLFISSQCHDCIQVMNLIKEAGIQDQLSYFAWEIPKAKEIFIKNDINDHPVLITNDMIYNGSNSIKKWIFANCSINIKTNNIQNKQEDKFRDKFKTKNKYISVSVKDLENRSIKYDIIDDDEEKSMKKIVKNSKLYKDTDKDDEIKTGKRDKKLDRKTQKKRLSSLIAKLKHDDEEIYDKNIKKI